MEKHTLMDQKPPKIESKNLAKVTLLNFCNCIGKLEQNTTIKLKKIGFYLQPILITLDHCIHHTGTSFTFSFHIAVAHIWKDQRILSKITRIKSLHIKLDFYKIDLKLKPEKQL